MEQLHLARERDALATHGNGTIESDADPLLRENARLNAEMARLERDTSDLAALAAVAAHEMMQPLIQAEAYACLLSERLSQPGDDELFAEIGTHLEEFRCGAARARRFAETMLRDSQSAGHPLERRDVDMAAIVVETVGLLRCEFAKRGVAVHVGELPEVRGDPVLLGGVVMNLLTNALKYGPRRNGEIRVEAKRMTGAWCFVFASRGRRISAAERERIFEPFVRGAQERRADGTGLGLALCRRVIERHGGDIRACPVRRWGNSFMFTLPD